MDEHYNDCIGEQVRDSSVPDISVNRTPEFGCWLPLRTGEPPFCQFNRSLSPFPTTQVLLT